MGRRKVIALEDVVILPAYLVRMNIVATNISARHITLTTIYIYDNSIITFIVKQTIFIDGAPEAQTFNLVAINLVQGPPAAQVVPAEAFTDELIAALTTDVVERSVDKLSVRIGS